MYLQGWLQEVADGSRQTVDEGGCLGWKRSLLSADRKRLYLQSETTCEGGNESRQSGAFLIAPGGRWIDIGTQERLQALHHELCDQQST